MLTVKTTMVKMMKICLKKRTPQKRLEKQRSIYFQLRLLTNLYNIVFGIVFVPGKN